MAHRHGHMIHLRLGRRSPDWPWIARRLLVLGDYGMHTEGFGKHVDELDFLEDEWLERWYGEPLPDYVVHALHAADRGRYGAT